MSALNLGNIGDLDREDGGQCYVIVLLELSPRLDT